MSVILTYKLEWTKFGDDGGDEAPCRVELRVNEMYAGTEQLACVRLRTEQREKRERSSESRECAVLSVDYSQTAKTVRNYAPQRQNQSSEGGDLLPAPCPTLIFSKTTPHFCLYPLSAITPFTTARLWRNWPGAYLKTFQLFRGSRSEIIETMVDWLGSTGRGRGAAEKRSKEKEAQRL